MSQTKPPSPDGFFRAVNAYHLTEAMRAGIEVGLFTAIAAGAQTVTALAAKTKAAPRGLRILADYLVLHGYLTKVEDRYRLTPDSAAFLDAKSPHYLGGALDFLLAPAMKEKFTDLAESVRRGGTAHGQGSVEPEHPMWVAFARAMAPLTALPAKLMSELVERPTKTPLSVLDIAASHGSFGLAFAARFPKSTIVAQDWANVLQVAEANARAAGCAERVRMLPGSAFEVELGGPHDVVLLTNFLHHFDRPTCVGLLKRVRKAMGKDSVCLTLEFVVDEDRLGPPAAAGFALIMLASTPAGDAYTFSELSGMFQEAGFSGSSLKPLLPGMQQVVVSRR